MLIRIKESFVLILYNVIDIFVQIASYLRYEKGLRFSSSQEKRKTGSPVNNKYDHRLQSVKVKENKLACQKNKSIRENP